VVQDRTLSDGGLGAMYWFLVLVLVVIVCAESGRKKGTSGGGKSDGVLDCLYMYLFNLICLLF